MAGAAAIAEKPAAAYTDAAEKMLTGKLDNTKLKNVKRDGTMTPAERAAIDLKSCTYSARAA